MTRTLRTLACATLLSASYMLSGCCAVLDACSTCVGCLLSGPSLGFAAPPQDMSVELSPSLDEDTGTTTAVSY